MRGRERLEEGREEGRRDGRKLYVVSMSSPLSSSSPLPSLPFSQVNIHSK